MEEERPAPPPAIIHSKLLYLLGIRKPLSRISRIPRRLVSLSAAPVELSEESRPAAPEGMPGDYLSIDMETIWSAASSMEEESPPSALTSRNPLGHVIESVNIRPAASELGTSAAWGAFRACVGGLGSSASTGCRASLEMFVAAVNVYTEQTIRNLHARLGSSAATAWGVSREILHNFNEGLGISIWDENPRVNKFALVMFGLAFAALITLACFNPGNKTSKMLVRLLSVILVLLLLGSLMIILIDSLHPPRNDRIHNICSIFILLMIILFIGCVLAIIFNGN